MNAINIFLIILTACCMTASAAVSEDVSKIRILLLTKSSGYEHSVIKYNRRGTSHVERFLAPVVEGMNATLTCTKDASLINTDSLANYDVVVFYTSGNLTDIGEDGNPPMSEEGLEALFDWIRGGGGFIGFHSATDSFKSNGDTPTPYIEMLGGEFVTHGAQFEGTVKKVSAEHPAAASLPETWALTEEWYLFRHFNKKTMHVIALLEIGKEREKQDKYAIPDYPVIWCSAYGKGRVLYNAMGHREDVWTNTTFQAIVEDHIRWASGEGASQTEANYDSLKID